MSTDQGKVERASPHRSARDAAIIAALLYAGARGAELADVADPAGEVNGRSVRG